MSFDFSTLITDRTQSDVANLKALLSKAGSLTEEELAEFNLARHKGAYNYTDLNRVTEAMDYLDGILKARGYKTAYQSMSLWSKLRTPTPSQMQQYLANANALKAAVSAGVLTDLPSDMERLTVAEANAIEKVLLEVQAVLDCMTATAAYSGEFYSGEV